MFQLTICGHIGANAEVGSKDGRQYTTFRVAVSRGSGDKEETQWVSCIMSGDAGKLLQYLVKGQQVIVTGEAWMRLVSSPKLKRMVVGVDINVRSVELVGKRPDTRSVPSQLCTPSGELHNIYQAFYVHPDELSDCTKPDPNNKSPFPLMFDMAGRPYTVDPNGFVMPYQEQQSEQQLPADNASTGDTSSEVGFTETIAPIGDTL